MGYGISKRKLDHKNNGARNVACRLDSLNESHCGGDDLEASVGTIQEAYETVRNPNRA